MEPILLLTYIAASSYGYSVIINICDYIEKQRIYRELAEIRDEIKYLSNDIAYVKIQNCEIQRSINTEI